MNDGWPTELFGCPLGDLPLLGQTIGRRQTEAAAAAAATHGMALRFGSGVIASDALIDSLCLAAKPGRPAAAAVAPGPAHDEFGQNRFGAESRDGLLHYELVAGEDLDQPTRPTPAVLDHIDRTIESPQPGRMARPILAPRGQNYIWTVGHWSDLLVANLLALQARTYPNPDPVIDVSASIHPTAVVERSNIGPGVVIGPLAVIRDSIVGAGCRIDEQTSLAGSFIDQQTIIQTGALIHGSVVGPDTVVSFHTAIRGSVLLGASTISAPVVARSVIGRNVFLARNTSIGATTITDDPVRVRIGRRTLSSGIHLLGCAIGNGARIGNGIDLPAGYEVPADTYLVDRPLPRLNPDAERRRPLALIDRTFRSLGLSKGPAA